MGPRRSSKAALYFTSIPSQKYNEEHSDEDREETDAIKMHERIGRDGMITSGMSSYARMIISEEGNIVRRRALLSPLIILGNPQSTNMKVAASAVFYDT